VREIMNEGEGRCVREREREREREGKGGWKGGGKEEEIGEG
jgi:hypothetical protein